MTVDGHNPAHEHDPGDPVPHDPAGSAATFEAPPARPVHPTSEMVLKRALHLKCPRCGEQPMFRGWFRMHHSCPSCGYLFERAPGYFLGSIYVNYGITVILLTVAYGFFHFGLKYTNAQLAIPLVAFCVVWPLLWFRYARALWIAFDFAFDDSLLDDHHDDRTTRES